ncbi:MAG: carboxypeptidase-like regulatory domain-containing protein [Kofleriaceae bacterium]
MTRLAVLIPLALVGCADTSDPCAEMSAKLAACFPDVTTIAPTCDADVADQVNSMSCDELAARDGKADSWTCVWMPWLPSCSGGGSSSSGKRIEVSTEECGPGALCPYVTGASCGLVTLHQGSHEVARGFSSSGGRFTFDGLAAGEYTVKVHERDSSLARMFVDDLSDETAPSSMKVIVESGATWARFNLVHGSAAAMTRCADIDGNLTVKAESTGAAVDRHLVEWDWIVELETDGAVVDRTRPLFIHHEASGSGRDENVLAFRQLRAGTHTLRFVRMDIPSYKQKPNPDYADLVRYYRADDVDPIEVTITVSAAQASGRTITVDRTLVDPLR